MSGECKVCYDTKILENTSDAGCTHPPSVCLECLRRVNTCPICREPLQQFLAARAAPANAHHRVAVRAPPPRPITSNNTRTSPVVRRVEQPSGRAIDRTSGVAVAGTSGRVVAGTSGRAVAGTSGTSGRAVDGTSGQDSTNNDEDAMLARDLRLIQEMEDMQARDGYPHLADELAHANDLRLIQQMQEREARATNTTDNQETLLAIDLLLIQEMEEFEALRSNFNAAVRGHHQMCSCRCGCRDTYF